METYSFTIFESNNPSPLEDVVVFLDSAGYIGLDYSFSKNHLGQGILEIKTDNIFLSNKIPIIRYFAQLLGYKCGGIYVELNI